jgi:integrase
VVERLVERRRRGDGTTETHASLPQRTPPESSNRTRLTQQTVVEALTNHEKGRKVRLWDDGNRKGGVPELYLQITPAGTGSYCLRYRRPGGGYSDYTIGQASRVTADQARAKAVVLVSELTLNGTDPVKAREAQEREARESRLRTLKALAADYQAAPRERPLSERTTKELARRLDTYVNPRIGSRPYGDLTRREIRECLREIWKAAGGNPHSSDGARTANLCHGDIKAVLSWALEEDLLDANPAAFPKMFDDRPVKRVGKLSEETLKALWAELEAEREKGWGAASVIGIQLCFVTLQRPNEITKANRADFDWKAGVWRIHPDRTKTNVSYEVPLTDQAVELFQAAFKEHNSEWAFPSDEREGHIDERTLSHRFGKTRKRLVKAKKMPADVELYDARRFGRTCLTSKLGVLQHIAERVLNHAEDRSIAATYDVADYSADVRKAHEAWTAELRRIVSREETPTAGAQQVAR